MDVDIFELESLDREASHHSRLFSSFDFTTYQSNEGFELGLSRAEGKLGDHFTLASPKEFFSIKKIQFRCNLKRIFLFWVWPSPPAFIFNVGVGDDDDNNDNNGDDDEMIVFEIEVAVVFKTGRERNLGFQLSPSRSSSAGGWRSASSSGSWWGGSVTSFGEKIATLA